MIRQIAAPVREELFPLGRFPERANRIPQLRYMGSKSRLLTWIHEVLSELPFTSALDPFSGSGCVAYLLKCMGKRVLCGDFLNFPYHISSATIENVRYRLSALHCERLLRYNRKRRKFIELTFKDIFYTPEDLRFLDTVWSNIPTLPTRYHKSLAIAALIRSCIKRQPRGVFTVAGDPEHYKDGRRDLKLSLREHFLESVDVYNRTVFDNGHKNLAFRADVLGGRHDEVDLVYFDPPYVPRSDDNCYIKRYHFLEGLSSYWTDEGTTIMTSTKVRKIPKRFTPFSYRRTSVKAFREMFEKFKKSILVLSYSSNAYPDLDMLVALMKRYKRRVDVHERPHRYHFGTHRSVSAERAKVHEYLIVGLS